MISSKPLNILSPNLVVWCIITSGSVMQKDWFAIFKVRVTARVHMNKIWQFLLNFLNCWSFCYQTWFNSTLSKARVSYKEIKIIMFKVNVTAKFQNVKECFSRLLNHWTFYHQNWYSDPSPWARLSTKKIGLLSSKIRVTFKDHIIKIWFLSSELLIILQLGLVWWHIIISWIVLWKDWTALL